jgi:2-dehydro-3-deoxygalactonokinase
MQPAVLIGLDWGTSSLRAYRIAADGAVLARRESARGILTVLAGAFDEALAEAASDWLAAEPHLPVLASGMIGSRQGWREAAYAACPAGAEELARRLVQVKGPMARTVHIAPGLSTRDAEGVPDVMRGEETQIVGELAARGTDRGRFVLPGTHSKWVEVADGRIGHFATYMTGEVFDVLRRHSILGRLMQDAPPDADAFHRGLDHARRSAAGGPGRLLHDVFGARTLGLMGDLPETALASWLSGLLIGVEITAAGSPAEPVVILGSGVLTRLYADAAAHLGLKAEPGSPDCVASGLLLLARTAGLIGSPDA